MKILIADDSSLSRKILRKNLVEWGHDVIEVDNGEAAKQVLHSQDAPRLAILDWMMPVMEGPEVCSWIRKYHKEPYIFVILLTAKERKEDFATGLESGADDYLTKPFSSIELRARIDSAQRMLDLLAELRTTRDALHKQATHDSLTGLFNRSEIFRILEVELDRNQRQQSSLSVLLADLDHFKRINDTYGHPAGDKILCEISKRMGSLLRKYDSVGRYGGEEFLIVLPGCDRPAAMSVAERHLGGVAGEPFILSQKEILVTLSIGVATTGGMQRVDANSLFLAADKALYTAKKMGRNRSEFSVEVNDMRDDKTFSYSGETLLDATESM